MNAETTTPTYHVLLVGIDCYPPGYNSLHGCVNDIDAIEQLLLTPPGIGIPPEQIRVTRLAAPHANHASTWHSPAVTLAPTKTNLIQALQALGGPTVKDTDRVLIYYSGHGDEKLWQGSSVWHEALVPLGEHDIEYLFDVEINPLVNAIAARTSDLTIVLDSCHSAGATRDLTDIQGQGAFRALKRDRRPVTPPNLAALGLDNGAGLDRALGIHMFQATDADYLVVVACQPDEKAGEGAYPLSLPSNGVFTHSLLRVLAEKNDATERGALRWADIWPALLASSAERNAQLGQRAQHPWIIGRSERKVFGGRWEKMDAGYRVTRRTDGTYEIGAGSLMGVTVGAEIAVYGETPRWFPPIGSAEDKHAGCLTVSTAEHSSAVAVAVEPSFILPEGARGRLVKPGTSERLCVSMKPAGTPIPVLLQESPLLEIVPATAPYADIEVIAPPGSNRWAIGDDVEPLLATVPAGEDRALRAGLEHYYRFKTVLRMARNCNDLQLSNSLIIQLLDCNDTAALAAMSAQALADPNLPEAPRDQDRIYDLQQGFKFCVKATNRSRYPLYVTLLNCSAGGLVEYLSDGLLRADSAQVMWLDGRMGAPFESWPDELPRAAHGIVLLPFATDRIVAMGTTRPDLDLRYLTLDKRVQEVVDEYLPTRGLRPLRPAPVETPAGPTELWTATVIPIRLPR